MASVRQTVYKFTNLSPFIISIDYPHGFSSFLFFGILFYLVPELYSLSLDDWRCMIMRNIFQVPIDKLIVLSSSKTGFAAIFVTIGTNHTHIFGDQVCCLFTFFSVMEVFLSNQQIMPFFGFLVFKKVNERLRYLSKPWLTNQIGLYRLVFDSRRHHLIGCNWKPRPLFRQFKLWHRPTGSSVRLVYLNHGCNLCLVGSFPLYRMSITALASGTSSDFLWMRSGWWPAFSMFLNFQSMENKSSCFYCFPNLLVTKKKQTLNLQSLGCFT